MGRAAPSKIKLSFFIIGVTFLVAAGGSVIALYASSYAVHTETNAAHQLVQISYRGQDGTDALTLLRQHADVQVKHYSFGDMVVVINNMVGNGPKYWTFYINGKEAAIGAGAYSTKSTDTLMWRLQ